MALWESKEPAHLGKTSQMIWLRKSRQNSHHYKAQAAGQEIALENTSVPRHRINSVLSEGKVLGRMQQQKRKGRQRSEETWVRVQETKSLQSRPHRARTFPVRRPAEGGELAPVTSCTVQLLAARDWRWRGTCATSAPPSYGQEVKARATSASHQSAWPRARVKKVQQRNVRNQKKKQKKKPRHTRGEVIYLFLNRCPASSPGCGLCVIHRFQAAVIHPRTI